MSKTTPRDKAFAALAPIRAELKMKAEANRRRAEALRRAEEHDAWAELKADTWKLRRK
jgi:hypothetical protein